MSSSTSSRPSADGALQLHENAPGNIVMDWPCGDADATEQALAEAEVVVKQRLVNQRLIPTPMEPRGAAAQYEPATGEYTVWMTSQTPHIMRLLMTAFVFGIPETKMRCIAPHVGGGFGTKIFLYHEYVLMAALAEKVGRPVKWMETRRENYVATTHGRDHVTYLEVGAKRDGTITALKAKTYANLGGILSTIAPGIPTTLYGRMLSGAYRFPNIHCQVLGVYTNTGMVDAYRGRRQAGGDLRRRARRRPGRARAGARPGRGPPQELHPARRLPVRPVGVLNGLQVRHRRLREGARPRARDRRLRGLPRASKTRRGARGGSAGSASRPTSRSAAWHRPPGSERSARAGARRCGRARTCACT